MRATEEFPRHWIFQAMPERYDLADKLIPQQSEPWTLSKFVDQVQAGDFVYFWRGGRQAGIYGWGVINETLTDSTDPESDTSWHVLVTYRERFSQPLLKEVLVSGSQSVKLAGLSILRAPQGTNFKVTTQEAISLNRLIGERSEVAPDDPEGTDSGQFSAKALAPLSLSRTTRRIVASGILYAENSLNQSLSSFSMLWVLLALAKSSIAPPRGTARYFQKTFEALEIPAEALQALESDPPDWNELFSRFHISQDALNVLESARLLAIFSSRKEEINLRHLFAGILLSGDEDLLIRLEEICASLGVSLWEIVERFSDFTVSSFPSDDSSLWLSQFQAGVQERLDRLVKRQLKKAAVKGELKQEADLDFEPVVAPVEAVERALTVAFGGRPVPDRPTGADLLQIKSEVEVLAHLFASRENKDPETDQSESATYALGLFGRWGAGKSFFIEKLKEKIAELAEQGKAGESNFYREIVQIEFNAWHYNESDIWASLVHHIFDTLQKRLQKEEFGSLIRQLEVSQEQRDRLNDEIREKEQESSLLEKQISEQETQIEEKIQEQMEKIEALPGRLAANKNARDKLNKLLPDAAELLGLPTTDLKKNLATGKQSASELLTLFREGGVFSGRAQLVGKTILHSRISKPAAVSILLFFVLYFGLPVWLEKKDLWENLMSTPGQVIAFFSSLLLWLRARLMKASEFFGNLTAIEAELRKDVRFEQEQKDLALNALQDERERIAAEIAQKNRKRDQLDQEIVQLRGKLGDLGTAESLSDYIKDRAASEDYRSKLGILALIRRDFQKLSELMTARQTVMVGEGGEEDGRSLPKIERIILYIDDLDRVQDSKKVLQVLEAVHLLLAFPLFHVVVAVDERWAARAVLSHHREFFDVGDKTDLQQSRLHDMVGGQRATPREFLEKIFQISFWVRPLSLQLTSEMIDGIVKQKTLEQLQEQEASLENEDELDLSEPNDTVAKQSLAASPSGNVGVAARGRDDEAEPEPAQSSEVTSAEQSRPQHADTSETKDRISFEITEEELISMRALAPVIGRSPRTVKRFISIYRLFKAMKMPPGNGARLADDEIASLITEQHVPIMVLLAIQIGHPDVAVQLFGALDEALNIDDSITMGGFIEKASQVTLSEEQTEQRWDKALEGLTAVISLHGQPPRLVDLSISALNPWLLATSRFGFQEWIPKLEGEQAVDEVETASG